MPATAIDPSIATEGADALWESADDLLAGIAASDLVSVGLDDPDPVAVEVRRLPSVYPVYETASTDAAATVSDWTRCLVAERIVQFGRQGLGVPDNIHHVLAMGEVAAAATRGDGSFDNAAWLRSLEGFREHVVED